MAASSSGAGTTSSLRNRRVELRVNPIVLELTGKKTPNTGLEGKFSVYHAAAIGLLYGRADESDADAVVRNPR